MVNGTRGSFPLLLALAAALAPPAPAEANDSIIYGGDWCLPEDSGATGVSYLGYANSSSASARVLVCPMIRQLTTNYSGFASAEVEGYAPSGGSLSCVIYSRNASGTVIDSDSDSFTGPGETELTFSDPGDSSVPGFYDMKCTLTGSGAKLYNYEFWEYASAGSGDDAALFPGVLCRAASQAEQDDLDYLGTGAVSNGSGSSETVECPLVKDNRNDDDGFDLLEADVYEPANTSMTCSAYAYDHDGDQWDIASDSTISGQDVATFSALDSIAGGFHFIRCSVPAGGRVISIYGVEDA